MHFWLVIDFIDGVDSNKCSRIVLLDILHQMPVFGLIHNGDDFFSHFACRDVTFAIELKVGGCERDVADMIFKYGVEEKTVVTSFNFEYIRAFKEYAGAIRVGYLTCNADDGCIRALADIGAEEICPKGEDMTKEKVELWHSLGLNVRAWGISDDEIMKKVYDIGADGMTVNFPDRLISYIRTKESEK